MIAVVSQVLQYQACSHFVVKCRQTQSNASKSKINISMSQIPEVTIIYYSFIVDYQFSTTAITDWDVYTPISALSRGIRVYGYIQISKRFMHMYEV